MLSACLVVYNEEKMIARCLDSIKDLVDEIIVIHDGECSDRTLEIARKYTDKIFVQPHIGEAEEHRVFALNQAKGDWVLQIDADEYLDITDHERIKQLISHDEYNGFLLKWELWDGKKAITFSGLKKLCLYKKDHFHYIGVPHDSGLVDGGVQSLDIFLHHRPAYNNVAWSAFLKKTKKWVPIHAKYFFPELARIKCFNISPEKWVNYTKQVRRHPIFFIVFHPLKIFFGQLKNGLGTNFTGLNLLLQQYWYYVLLYLRIWSLNKKNKNTL